jgi:hypothetical protein
MHGILILAIFAIFFASCHNDVPGLPSTEEVQGYKYCKYANPSGGVPLCKSTYQISKKSCVDINFPPMLNDSLTIEQKENMVLYCDVGCTKKVCEE